MRRRAAMAKRRCILRAMACLALLAAVVLLGCFAYSKIQEKREIQKQDDLRDLFEGASDQAFALPLMASARAEEQPDAVNRAISDRFAELYGINPEIIGWLEAGEDISTPIVYRDNEYYLDHDFYGDESVSGTVFADVRNAAWETDRYLVFYGHNMKNGTMFGTLDEYQELDHLLDNTCVDFYGVYDNQVTQFVPFAVVDASMDKEEDAYLNLRRFSLFQVDESTGELVQQPEGEMNVQMFIDDLLERSMYEIPGLDVTAEDRILALVTCSYKLPNARITVFCRELREGETHEQMEALIRRNAKKK